MNRSYKLIALVMIIGVVGLLAGWFITNDTTDNSRETTTASQQTASIPDHLLAAFPDTDWSKTDASIATALSGGPGKDGIPAIDDPDFVALADASQNDLVQAIVIQDGDTTKVYPYNILNWHEIVNDTANDRPIAVTFCPLCGSAIVFDRTLSSGAVSTFGVSGSLIESNMVMYDRETESLWQQSTGVSVAGEFTGDRLAIVEFQLLSMGDIRQQFPDAVVLSEDTGYSRDYANNPYSGYEDTEQFIFSPSSLDARYPAKDIFVAFRVDDAPVAVPWLILENGNDYETTINDQVVKLAKNDGQLEIIGEQGQTIPFYFEMWFSWAVQHDNGIVFDPTT